MSEDGKNPVDQWNDAHNDLLWNQTICRLFQEQAKKVPLKTALIYEKKHLTYKELNERSNQLARQIRKKYLQKTKQALKKDTLIALYLDRGLEMVIGMLAVLKAGGAYVPMDPAFPQTRIDYVLNDTEAELILCQRSTKSDDRIHLPEDKLLMIDLTERFYKSEISSNLKNPVGPTDLAYVIYTSGTTGSPKGVMIEHHSIVNTVHALFPVYDQPDIRRTTAYTSYVFDVSVSEIWTSLLLGQELHIISNNVRKDSNALSAYFMDHEIHLAYLPPVLLSQFPEKDHPHLKCLIYAGEPCDKRTAERWSGKVKLFNYYGPTEACIYATGKQIAGSEVEQIGKPIQNIIAYVLDEHMNLLPDGSIGELYLGGEGIARGYWKRPELTAERFVCNPFITDDGRFKKYDRLYKTGDLVRRLPDGNLVFLGRNDDQVKLRGYRIELGEIEQAIIRIDGINQCCVQVRERVSSSHHSKYLVAYYIAGYTERKIKITPEQIIARLHRSLPEYMIPSAFIELETFPLTINGKLDKRALPDPVFSSTEEYVAPVTEQEIMISNIWKELLGTSRVGCLDDFFKLGGDSILALQASHRMSKALAADVKVADLFEYKTISALLPVLNKPEIIIPVTNEPQHVLSSAQERLWFIEQYEQGTNAYHLPLIYELRKDASVEAVKYAMQMIVSRHEILRTTIDHAEHIPNGVQVINDYPLSIDEIVLTAADELESLLKKDINHPFDLRNAYPIRVKFYHIVSDKHPIRTILLINLHHIAGDGWSLDILQEELISYYHAFCRNDLSFHLPEPGIHYKDYAVWQKKYLTDNILTTQLNYWKTKLEGFSLLELPTDYSRPAKSDYAGAMETVALSKELSADLKQLSRQNGVTLHSMMLCGLSILLGKYTSQNDIITGSPVANRHFRQTEKLIGFFVNTQVNRVMLRTEESFLELMERVHDDQTEAQKYQDIPFEKLVDALAVERNTAYHPVFQVTFGVQRFGNKGRNKTDIAEVIDPKGFYEVSQFDLSVVIDDTDECYAVQVNYATKLFQAGTIKRLIHHYVYLLEQLVKQPSVEYHKISLLDNEEYERIIHQWNHTATEYDGDGLIHRLFEQQVKKDPDRSAIICGNATITYNELNERSNRLAHRIRNQYQQRVGHPLPPDTIVALCTEKKPEMIIGMFGILKAGAAYVPVDPNYPEERLKYILNDIDGELILGQKQLCSNQQLFPAEKMIFIDTEEDIIEQECTAPEISTQPDHLAYVIYTSGTTGTPKGVLVSHRNYLHLNGVDFINTYFENRVFWSNYTFDVSVYEIFTALLQGSKLYMLNDDIRYNSEALFDFFAEKKINHSYIPPFFIKDFANYLQKRTLPSFKQVFTGVEKVYAVDINRILSNQITVLNAYGPTETTVCSTAYVAEAGSWCKNEQLPIGRPLANETVYVLDAGLNPVPVNVIGELYIGGAGVSRGYLNRPDLTAERFLNNPFATSVMKAKGYNRMYKTGDLVKWLPDGNLEYINRNDDQIKIRGFRIELGEIEYALSIIPGIRQCCVLARTRSTPSGPQKYLVAYYISDLSSAFSRNELFEKLSRQLPEYMVPGVFHKMESFPLTNNGKLDKRALPDPLVNDGEQYVEPVNDLERQLCGIYADVLGLQPASISTQENFFRMGGNSLLCVLLKQKLQKLREFKQVTVADLFKYNSVQKLIQHVEGKQEYHYKLQNTINGGDHQIAIISMSGAFSGAEDLDAFWNLIANGREGLRFYSKEECAELGVPASAINDMNYVPVIGKVEGMEDFDPLFWNLSPNESRQLDPQIRKFVEHSWYALESSGYLCQRRDLVIGVFAGSGMSDYFYDHILHGELSGQINKWEASVSNNKDALATKTAYLLDLSGPANSINTACSTGLVSIVEACQKLQLGVCNMALAGGVSLVLPEQVGYIYQDGMIYSRDGHCRSFDKNASGTVSGSGVAVVLLKRLSDAVRDEDRILGVIKGYATNNDGARKTGYTAPSLLGQSECIINAQKMAGIFSDEVEYVECHGTATPLGDPIEVQALKEAFEFNQHKPVTRNGTTVLGSVKANIGHTDSAAGAAGLIKVCTMLQHRQLPVQANFLEPNPELHLEGSVFEILTESKPWLPQPAKERIAAVSSFGVGGTNAHVIIADYPSSPANGQDIETSSGEYILPFSAKSQQSLERYRKALLEYLRAHPLTSLRDLSYSLQEKKQTFDIRCAITGSTTGELIAGLENDFIPVCNLPDDNYKLVFMFPGQGVQYTGMVQKLYEQEPYFQAVVNTCISMANTHLNEDLLAVLYPREGQTAETIHQTEWTQICLFIIEYALAKYLDHLGIKAHAYIGHSVGEYVAATLSGVFRLEDAIRLVILRGQLMQSMEKGSMLAVSGGAGSIAGTIEKCKCELSVINSPEDLVVSGNEQAVQLLEKELEKSGKACVRLNTSHAFHSQMMERAAFKLEKAFESVSLNAPSVNFISNVSGDYAGNEVCRASYWSAQLRKTVQFSKGLDTLSNCYHQKIKFLEVGPGKGLSYFVNRYANHHHLKTLQPISLVPSLKDLRKESAAVLTAGRLKAILWMNGIIEKANASDRLKNARFIYDLPLYQFDQQRCWINRSKDTFSLPLREELLSAIRKEALLVNNVEGMLIKLESILNPYDINKEKIQAATSVTIHEEEYSEEELTVSRIICEVLGIETISVEDDFFRLGGNSISAIQVSHLISKTFHCDLKVADIFNCKSVKGICSLLKNSNQPEITIPPVTEKRAALSFAQERLWFIEQYEQGSNAYHLPELYELNTRTDQEAIIHALQKIMERHEILRTTIEQPDDSLQGIQVVHDAPLMIEEVTSVEEDIFSQIKAEVDRPFDLSHEYPIRVKFFHHQQNAAAKTYLLINTHHIASDGWSKDIFHKELSDYYHAYCDENKDFRLPPVEVQYRDFSVWQKKYISGPLLNMQLDYWKKKLSGCQTLEIPTDHVRPGKIDYRGKQEEFVFSREMSDRLRSLAQRNGVTLHSVMLASLSILLGKYCGQLDIISGSPIANRHHRQTEKTIGFFVNTQANRVQLHPGQCFEELLLQVHQDQAEAQRYQDLPFEKLVDELGVDRDTSRHPVFQCMFGVQNFGAAEKMNSHLFRSVPSSVIYQVSQFDLSVFIDDSSEQLSGLVIYATSLFNKNTIERFIRHYIFLLDQLLEQPGKPYLECNLLLPEEYDQIMHQWNNTRRDYPKNKTLVELFEEQVMKNPDAVALIVNGKRFTYRDLNQSSNQLANYLRARYSIKPDDLVAIKQERTEEMIICLLGTLKSGAAYVPIDPDFPEDRIEYILEDSQSKVLLDKKEWTRFLSLAKDYSDTNPGLTITSNNLAYVIYTSGSTGRPKGCMLEHRGVVNRLEWMWCEYGFNAEDVILQKTTYTFDVSVWELFLPLCWGCRMITCPKEAVASPEHIAALIAKEKVTCLHFVPSMLAAFIHGLFADDANIGLLNSLKRVITSGEALALETVKQWYAKTPVTIHNLYGPTEASVDVSYFQTSGNDTKIPIGRPIWNTQLYVVDAMQQLLPIGVIGEICLGGDGLARGYLNKPELTAQKFIANPYKAGERIYKTGDLGRWLPDGNLEYIGRNDDQVKIRGYRIELGEIEQVLSAMPGINQCCVLAKSRQTAAGLHKYLVAYYVPETTYDFSGNALFDYLSQHLPEYMVPAVYQEMKSFPLTSNGKLDKRSLPDPGFSEEVEDVQPVTELEMQLCRFYAEVLDLTPDRIGMRKNFFRMGGTSLLCIQLKQKLQAHTAFRQITVADLFKYNSIEKLIQFAQKDQPDKYKFQSNVKDAEHEIAIIGMSGAFSGAADLNEFWELIAGQKEGLKLYSKEECLALGISPSLVNHPDYIPVMGKVEGMEDFDPLFWNLSPNECRQLDPQIRKFLEHCWYALESSGYLTQRHEQTIGVFAGSGVSDYFYEHILHGEMAEEINKWEATVSNNKDALATKTAYLLDLSGPANSVNTACSTGLVAIVEACKNIFLGTCDMALAGGVSLFLPDQIGYIHEPGMIASRDGHCRTFDKAASGTVGGSGVGVVLLKRLSQAIHDKDRILGVIKGYATNNDGARKTSYTAPSLLGQSECIINAQKMAGIFSDQVEYVECHGTATPLGDPIEVQALKEAFAFNRNNQFTLEQVTVLGAVKANIGHTDSAAGAAGLIKVCEMLRHHLLPAQANFLEANPDLQLEDTSFEILTENKTWLPHPGKERIAAVSSFGVGGTNAHVILSDYPFPIEKEKSPQPSGDYILPLSAKNQTSLQRYRKALLHYLKSHPTANLLDLSYSLQEKKDVFDFRGACTGSSMEEMITDLENNFTCVESAADEGHKVVFMFPGQGVQYTGMARELYEEESSFRETVDKCLELANGYLKKDLREILYPNEHQPVEHIHQTEWTQISLFIIEYALAVYLEQQGIKPHAYIGHSIGEYVAATLSGVFSLQDAIRLVIRRGQLMQHMEAGSMLAINCSENEIKELINAYACEISVINSPGDLVVSGNTEAIKSLELELKRQGKACVALNTSHAFHSRMMEPASLQFEKEFELIVLHTPQRNFISNRSGELAGEEVTKGTYWSRQLRETVAFNKGISVLCERYHQKIRFLEVGPGKGLSYFINNYKIHHQIKTIQPVQLLPSMKERRNGECPGLTATRLHAILWMNGMLQKANAIDRLKGGRFIYDLPLYQFDNQRCWINKSTERYSPLYKEELLAEIKERAEQISSVEEMMWMLNDLFSSSKEKRSEEKKTAVAIRESSCTEEESRIAQIFAEILGVETISLHDDFFRIGGNSISAIQVSNRISKAFSCDVKVADIFKHKTIRGLLEKVAAVEVSEEGEEWEF